MTDSQNIKCLFMAISMNPNKNFCEDFNLLKEDFSSESVKWVQKEDFHVTLHYFGDTKTEKIPSIKSIMKKAVQNIQLSPFQLNLGGCDYFDNDKIVIYAKVEKHPSLNTLHESLQQLLAENNFSVNSQYFIPHLTLGRMRPPIKDYEIFKETIDDYQESFQWQQEVKELILFESVLNTNGPKYQIIETVKI